MFDWYLVKPGRYENAEKTRALVFSDDGAVWWNVPAVKTGPGYNLGDMCGPYREAEHAGTLDQAPVLPPL
jgi:hypothetical protein